MFNFSPFHFREYFLLKYGLFLTTWRWCLLWLWHPSSSYIHLDDIIITRVFTLHYFLFMYFHYLIKFLLMATKVCCFVHGLFSMLGDPCRLKNDKSRNKKNHSTCPRLFQTIWMIFVPMWTWVRLQSFSGTPKSIYIIQVYIQWFSQSFDNLSKITNL